MYIYITRLASNEIFSPSNKIHREVGRAKDLSAPGNFVILRHDSLSIEEFNVGVLSLDATLRVERLWSRLYQEWSSRRLGYNTCLPTRWWAWRRRRKPWRGGGSRVPCYSRLVGGRWKRQDCSFYGDFSVPEGANCPPAWSAKWLQEGGTSYLPVWLTGWLALQCRTRPRGGFSVKCD